MKHLDKLILNEAFSISNLQESNQSQFQVRFTNIRNSYIGQTTACWNASVKAQKPRMLQKFQMLSHCSTLLEFALLAHVLQYCLGANNFNCDQIDLHLFICWFSFFWKCHHLIYNQILSLLMHFVNQSSQFFFKFIFS